MYQIEYIDIVEKQEYTDIIQEVIKKCFETEKLEKTKLYISITLTTPENIKKINKEYRNIDQETDVLSFPMFEKNELKEKIKNNKFIEHQDILGDIVISIERVKTQAEEYGHSFKREFSYMLVHGFYHLMGEDHMIEEEKRQMREKEENVLNQLEIKRN